MSNTNDINNFDQATAIELLNSKEQFPVDFESAWNWAGYTRKENAKNKLTRNFSKGLEFCTKSCKTPNGGRPSVSYRLTTDCFKMFCMMAQTDKGREVRQYFLDCEQRLKENQSAPAAPTTPAIDKINAAAALSNTIAAALEPVSLAQNKNEKDSLIAGVKLSVLGLELPEHRASIMLGHQVLAASTPTPSILLTPTSIGKRLNLSARTTNNLLIDAGYQTRVPKADRAKGEPDYRPTESGSQYSSNTLATGNSGDNSTYQHLKWSEDIVAELRSFLNSAQEPVQTV